MATRIFHMGRKKSYPQRCAWGKMQCSRFESIKVKAATGMSGLVRGGKPTPDLSVESAVVRASMQAILEMFVRKQRSAGPIPTLLVALLAIGLVGRLGEEGPSSEVHNGEGVAV